MSICLTLSEQLDQEIHDKGIILEIASDMPEKFEAYYDNAYGVPNPYITINANVKSERARNALKAHELGHHENCICDLLSAPKWIRQKYETLADRWKLQRIMPIEKLIRAFIALYYQIYGAELQYGQYTIYWDPFNIKRDRRRRSAY